MFCPHCGAAIDHSETEAGIAVPCERCGAYTVVPSGMGPPSSAEPPPETPPPVPPRARPAEPPQTGWASAAASFGVAGYVPGFGLLAFLMSLAAFFALRGGRRSGLGGAVTGLVLGLGWTAVHAIFLASLVVPYFATRTDSGACEQRVARLGRALGEYRSTREREARSLEDLVEAGLVAEADTRCPDGGEPYVLVRYDLAAEDDMRLHEASARHGPDRVILTFDGKVELRSEGEFEADQMIREALSPK